MVMFFVGGVDHQPVSSARQGAGSSSNHWCENSVVCGDFGNGEGNGIFSQVIQQDGGKNPLVGSGTHPPMEKKHESCFFLGGKEFVQQEPMHISEVVATQLFLFSPRKVGR